MRLRCYTYPMLHKTIKDQIKDALRAKDTIRLDALRGLNALALNEILASKAPASSGSGAPASQDLLPDDRILALIKKSVKQRKDSIEQFTKGNRPELAAKEAAEIVVIEEFLPKALGETELAELIGTVVAELIASLGRQPGAKDMGQVMKAVQAELQQKSLRAEGRAVSEAVKILLAG